MADYLSSLVARNIGTVSAREGGEPAILQPRPRSRFEPASPFPISPDSGDLAEAGVPSDLSESNRPAITRMETYPPAHRGRLDSSQPYQPSTQYDPGTTYRPPELRPEHAGEGLSQRIPGEGLERVSPALNAADEHPEQIQKEQPDRTSSELVAPEGRPERSRRTHPSTSLRTHAEIAAEGPLEPAGNRRSIHPERAVDSQSLNLHPERSRGTLTPSPVPLAEPPGANPPEVQAQRKQHEPPESNLQPHSPAPATQGPDLQPALPPMPDLPVQPAPDSGPTIQVSIGRIEVRAVSDPTPAPARPASRPLIMSLEDYLKSRANGGAR